MLGDQLRVLRGVGRDGTAVNLHDVACVGVVREEHQDFRAVGRVGVFGFSTKLFESGSESTMVDD